VAAVVFEGVAFDLLGRHCVDPIPIDIGVALQRPLSELLDREANGIVDVLM